MMANYPAAHLEAKPISPKVKFHAPLKPDLLQFQTPAFEE